MRCHSKMAIQKAGETKYASVSCRKKMTVLRSKQTLKPPQRIIKSSVLVELLFLSAMCLELFIFQILHCTGNMERVKGRIFTIH